MPNCKRCDSHVSEKFAQIFSHDGTIRACPECSDWGTIRGGGTAKGPENATTTWNKSVN